MSSVLVKTEALFSAIRDHKLSDAEELLKDGANPNRLLLNGVTPLHLAIAAESTSSFEYVKLLLQYNGNPNVCDADGITPLHVAAQWGKADCLALLLQNGADVSLCDREGRDVNWFAKDSEHCKCIIDEFIAAKNECAEVDLSIVTNYSDQLTTPPSTKKRFSIRSPLQQIDCNKDNNYLKVRKDGKYILDATSPDNCFFVFKPVKQVKSKNVLLHDTLLISNNLTISVLNHDTSLKIIADGTTSQNQDGTEKNNLVESNETLCHCEKLDCFSKTGAILAKAQPTAENVCASDCFVAKSSCTESDLVTPSTTHPISISLHSESISVKQLAHETTIPSTWNSDSNSEISDEQCHNMLFATKHATNCVPKHDSLSNRMSEHIDYESIPVQDSICTFADSTVPIEDISLNRNYENSKISVSPSSVNKKPQISVSSSLGNNAINPCESLNSSQGLDESSLPIKLSLSVSSVGSSDETISYDWQKIADQSSYEEVDTTFMDEILIPSRIENMTNLQLRSELIKLGFVPGPIEPGRKQYMKRLLLLEQHRTAPISSGPRFSRELTAVLQGKSLPRSVVDDDEKLRNEFDDSSQCVRGGTAKDSFNYLLLDPRVTQNLPDRAKTLSEAEALKVFVGATFYVGKGKKSRPYAHLKEAARDQNTKSDKIRHIHDIWKTDGVISLHVFQNVVACEAFTREAALIEAFGLDHLTNCVRGKCYGSAQTWNGVRLRQYGTFLTIRAMQMLLLEGERQIRPHQVSSRKAKH